MANNFFVKLAPYFAGTGASLVNLDENESGPDDVVGHLLIYAAEVIGQVETGGDQLPPLPDILLTPLTGKITGATRTAIVLVSGPLMIAQFQLAASKPRLAKGLGYVSQVLQALAANRPVPTAPTSLMSSGPFPA